MNKFHRKFSYENSDKRRVKTRCANVARQMYKQFMQQIMKMFGREQNGNAHTHTAYGVGRPLHHSSFSSSSFHPRYCSLTPSTFVPFRVCTPITPDNSRLLRKPRHNYLCKPSAHTFAFFLIFYRVTIGRGTAIKNKRKSSKI